MMPSSKKLVLKKSTLRVLSTEDLGEVVGGHCATTLNSLSHTIMKQKPPAAAAGGVSDACTGIPR